MTTPSMKLVEDIVYYIFFKCNNKIKTSDIKTPPKIPLNVFFATIADKIDEKMNDLAEFNENENAEDEDRNVQIDESADDICYMIPIIESLHMSYIDTIKEMIRHFIDDIENTKEVD